MAAPRLPSAQEQALLRQAAAPQRRPAAQTDAEAGAAAAAAAAAAAGAAPRSRAHPQWSLLLQTEELLREEMLPPRDAGEEDGKSGAGKKNKKRGGGERREETLWARKRNKTLGAWLRILRSGMQGMERCVVEPEAVAHRPVDTRIRGPGESLGEEEEDEDEDDDEEEEKHAQAGDGAAAGALTFLPPRQVDVVGSYMLDCSLRQFAEVDLVVQMPAACFEERDVLNHGYFHKRALYVAHLAELLQSEADSLHVGSVALSYFKGDTRKPVLRVHHRKRKDLVVRILPTVEPLAFQPSRLVPTQNNVRPHGWGTPQARTNMMSNKQKQCLLRPTPHYNNAVLEDMAMQPHLGLLHEHCQRMPCLPQAIALAKIWLSQRDFAFEMDGFDAHMASMLYVYLIETHHVASTQSHPLHLFSSFLKFLAEHDLAAEPLVMPRASGTSAAADSDDEDALFLSTRPDVPVAEFRAGFETVLMDPSGVVNVFARLSANGAAALRREAIASLRLLQHQADDAAFRQLFLDTTSRFWRQYDIYVRLPLVQPGRLHDPIEFLHSDAEQAEIEEQQQQQQQQQQQARVQEQQQQQEQEEDDEQEEVPKGRKGSRSGGARGERNGTTRSQSRLRPVSMVEDCTPWEVCARTTLRVLEKALSDRVRYMRVFAVPGHTCEEVPVREYHAAAQEWPVQALNVTTAGQRWRRRRSIPAVVVGLVLHESKAYRLVDRSLPGVQPGQQFRDFWGERAQLRRFQDGTIVEAVVWEGYQNRREHIVPDMLTVALSAHGIGHPSPKRIRVVGHQLVDLLPMAPPPCAPRETLVRDAMTQLTDLRSMLQRLSMNPDQIPLVVDSLLPACDAMRYTSLVPPVPHPLVASDDVSILRQWAGRAVTLQPAVLDVVVKFESSPKWPDELEALRSTKTAFLVRIAQCLRARHNLAVRTEEQYADVFKGGLVFRLRIHTDHELSLLDGNEHFRVHRSLVLSTQHHNYIHALATRCRAYAPAVQLLRRWMQTNMLHDVLRVEALELLVAYVCHNEGSSNVAAADGDHAARQARADEEAPTTSHLFAAVHDDMRSFQHAFLQVLHLIARYDWEDQPLIVDVHNDLSGDDRADINRVFAVERARGAAGMFIVAAYDRESGWRPSWTTVDDGPDAVQMQRLVTIAQEAAVAYVAWLGSAASVAVAAAAAATAAATTQTSSSVAETQEEEDWRAQQDAIVRERLVQRVFLPKSSQRGRQFSAIIRVRKSAMVCTPGLDGFGSHFVEQCLAGPVAAQMTVFRNLSKKELSTKSLLPGFEPLAEFVESLRWHFGWCCHFFYDPHGTGKIGVVFHPQAFLSQRFSLASTRQVMVVDAPLSSDGRRAPPFTIPNIGQILAEMRVLGNGIVTDVDLR